MRVMRLLGAAVSISLCVSATASASAPKTAPAPGDGGLRLIGTICAPGAVSGRVVMESGRAKWLYVSTAASLIIYDVSKPQQPVEAGRLPLPIYENEDVDGNDALALVAHDVPLAAPGSPVGGQIEVVSTRNKGQPQPLSVVSLPDGAGHTATCLDNCRWALASGGASLAAVDLGVPERPVASRVAAPAQSGLVHDADQDSDGVVWLAGTHGISALAMRPIRTLGGRVAKLSVSATPFKPVLLTSTGPAGSTPAVGAGILHGTSRPRDITYRPASGLRPGDVVLAGEEGTATDCRDGGRFHTFDARGVRTGAPLRLLDSVAPAEMKATTAPGLGAILIT